MHRAAYVFVAVFALGLNACYATMSAEPVYASDGYVTYYEEQPVYSVETYPRYDYNGTPVYLVGDRWYYRSGARWAYYGAEPPQLYHYRTHYYTSYGYAAPPAYGSGPVYRGHYSGAPHGYSGAPRAYAAPAPGYVHPGARPPTYHKPHYVAPPAHHGHH